MFRRSNNSSTAAADKKDTTAGVVVTVPEETITYNAPQTQTSSSSSSSSSLPQHYYGNSPSGTLHILQARDVVCGGYENKNNNKDIAAGTIQLDYAIPDGTQQAPYHYHPGVRYDGVKRRAYLPATPEGVQALMRLKVAFLRGHCFTVGYSATFQKHDQVTWNGAAVPHKTNLTSGGPFGFPDDAYLPTLHQALDALHIPSVAQLVPSQKIIIVLHTAHPFHLPRSPNLQRWNVVPAEWTIMSNKEETKCGADATLPDPNDDDPTISKIIETNRLRTCHIPITLAQRGVFLYGKEWMHDPPNNNNKKKKKKELVSGLTAIANAINDDPINQGVATLSSWKVTRNVRVALMTEGGLQLKAAAGWLVKANWGDRSGTVQIDWTQLRSVHVMEQGLIVLIHQDHDSVEEGDDDDDAQDFGFPKNDPPHYRVAVYQTMHAPEFLSPLLAQVTAAYAGMPTWAWPVRWSGNHWPALPKIDSALYRKEWLGRDGGLSSALFTTLIANHMRHKVPLEGYLRQYGRQALAKWIDNQQLASPHPFAVLLARHNQQSTSKGQSNFANSPYVIDLVKLVQRIASESTCPDIETPLLLQGLDALSFNLVIRKLKLCHWKSSAGTANERLLRNSLARLCLYNVTLRELNLSGTRLAGMGEAMGRGWAMNAQPLLSRLFLDHCSLTDRDMRGLLPGLARAWCGQTTAWPQVVALSHNPDVTTATWDLLFQALIDPASVPFWPTPTAPPPSAPLVFLQELRLLGTMAVGSGLVQFVTECKGLRTLTMSANGSSTAFVLHALTMSGAPVQVLHVENLTGDCCPALLNLASTLKTLTLTNFSGNASPLLCGWAQQVPQLSIQFDGKLNAAAAQEAGDTGGFSPGSLSVKDGAFGLKILGILSSQVNGLKHLEMHQMHYTELFEAAPMLALGGLETLQVYPPSTNISSHYRNEVCANMFWQAWGASKTLRVMILPNQICLAKEIAMIGQFLKVNRSVQKIKFDSSRGMLHVDSVAVLRSAFYGNKKVQELENLLKCRQNYMTYVKAETERSLQEIQHAKASIKRIFKSHYSKYNPNWRAKPNRLKLPFVEKIRVAKRHIGKLQRDSNKIALHLDAIAVATKANRHSFSVAKAEKDIIVQSRREGQLKNLAAKKQKILAKLIASLHKAKKRGRSQKSAKTQVPRRTYYQSPKNWPSTTKPKPGRVHSHYHYHNDPYNTRFHWYYGYYSQPYFQERHRYVAGQIPIRDMEAVPVEPDLAATAEGEVEEKDGEVDESEEPSDELAINPCVEGALEDVQEDSSELLDPWSSMDEMIFGSSDDLYTVVTSPEHLAAIHDEASELGLDVAMDISSCLDSGAAVGAKLDDIAESTDIDRATLEQSVDDTLDASLDLGLIESSLDNVGGYDASIEADDAVAMYAGAGPRDLDDGGPAFGGGSNAALSGSRRRARMRKMNRGLIQAHNCVRMRGLKGYSALSLSPNREQRKNVHGDCGDWPSSFVEGWMAETRAAQISVMAQADLFPLPEVSGRVPQVLLEWSADSQASSYGIDVILVTQCSLDRLPNLKAQLSSWRGKASIALFVKSNQDPTNAQTEIVELVKGLTERASSNHLQVAVSLVEGSIEDDAYPINFLRNVALLEAKRQHLRFHTSLEQAAVLLVDVDFRPSGNLYRVLHHVDSAKAVLHERRIIVCPAFEISLTSNCPSNTAEMKDAVMNGFAESFHQAHFPQGHGPTRYEKYWKTTDLMSNDDDPVSSWSHAYKVDYERNFEPYVVMAAADVPMYDERFCGYGLNKVSHLASVAKSSEYNGFYVLPGAFLVAPYHERSESWAQRYGAKASKSSEREWEESQFSQLWLKGLYCNFTSRLNTGRPPVVSPHTQSSAAALVTSTKTFKKREQIGTQFQDPNNLVEPQPRLCAQAVYS